MEFAAPIWVLVLITLLAMIISGILVACEESLDRLTRARALEAVAERRRNAQRLLWLAENWRFALSGVRSMAVATHMAAAVGITMVMATFTPTWWLNFLLTLLVSFTFIGLLLRTSPRRLGRNYPLQVTSLFAGLLVVIGKIGYVGAFLQRKPVDETNLEPLEDDPFEDVIDRASEDGLLVEDERELLESVFELGRTIVREVMVARIDMVKISATATPDQALSLFTQSGFSRVPVVGENSEEPLGILYLKDVLRRTHHRLDADNLQVSDMMRDALFVPESQHVDDLLDQMQENRVHIAIVVDEWGGVSGLVTIEDLLEELVGDMEDEHDRQMAEPEEISPGVWRVPALLPVDELGDCVGLEVDDDDVDTAGGLFAKALGMVPIEGSEVDVQGLHLVGERVEGRRKRLATILVSKVKPSDFEEWESNSQPSGQKLKETGELGENTTLKAGQEIGETGKADETGKALKTGKE